MDNNNPILEILGSTNGNGGSPSLSHLGSLDPMLLQNNSGQQSQHNWGYENPVAMQMHNNNVVNNNGNRSNDGAVTQLRKDLQGQTELLSTMTQLLTSISQQNKKILQILVTNGNNNNGNNNGNNGVHNTHNHNNRNNHNGHHNNGNNVINGMSYDSSDGSPSLFYGNGGNNEKNIGNGNGNGNDLSHLLTSNGHNHNHNSNGHNHNSNGHNGHHYNNGNGNSHSHSDYGNGNSSSRHMQASLNSNHSGHSNGGSNGVVNVITNDSHDNFPSHQLQDGWEPDTLHRIDMDTVPELLKFMDSIARYRATGNTAPALNFIAEEAKASLNWDLLSGDPSTHGHDEDHNGMGGLIGLHGHSHGHEDERDIDFIKCCLRSLNINNRESIKACIQRIYEYTIPTMLGGLSSTGWMISDFVKLLHRLKWAVTKSGLQIERRNGMMDDYLHLNGGMDNESNKYWLKCNEIENLMMDMAGREIEERNSQDEFLSSLKSVELELNDEILKQFLHILANQVRDIFNKTRGDHDEHGMNMRGSRVLRAYSSKTDANGPNGRLAGTGCFICGNAYVRGKCKRKGINGEKAFCWYKANQPDGLTPEQIANGNKEFEAWRARLQDEKCGRSVTLPPPFANTGRPKSNTFAVSTMRANIGECNNTKAITVIFSDQNHLDFIISEECLPSDAIRIPLRPKERANIAFNNTTNTYTANQKVRVTGLIRITDGTREWYRVKDQFALVCKFPHDRADAQLYIPSWWTTEQNIDLASI